MSSSTSPDPPGLTPPPGVVPYVTDPYTLAPYQNLTIVASIFTTTVLVSLRVFAKLRVLKAIKWEDYTCVLGWIFFMVFLAINWSIINHGGGIHQWNVTLAQVQYNYRFTNYGDTIYSLALLFTKLSILLLILRVFCSVKRDLLYYLTVLLIFINTLFYMIYFFIPIFLCNPRSKIWNKDEPGKCLKISLLYLSSGIFNTISDIAMLSVPLYLIWKLQMSLGRKIAVSAVFGTGALACIASVLRITYMVFLVRTKDYNFVRVQSTMWAYAEITFGILCGCLPIIPALFRYYTVPPTYQSPRDHISKAPFNHPTYTFNRPANTLVQSATGGGLREQEWVHLDGKSLPGLPSASRSYRGDEEALDSAVTGVETGRNRLE